MENCYFQAIVNFKKDFFTDIGHLRMRVFKRILINKQPECLSKGQIIKLSRRVFFVRGKMANAPKRPIHSLIHYITLNLNIATCRHNMKNLVNNFGGIYVRIMHAKFQWCGKKFI